MNEYAADSITFIDTSATKFLVFGSDNGGSGPNGGTP